jgi:hypothetical protein
MNERLDQLVMLLEQHIGLYQTLIDLLNREQSALMALKVDEVHETAKAKETIALKIKLQTPLLARTIQETAAGQGLAIDPLPTLAELSAAVPSPWSKQLERMGLSLARVKRTVISHNQANHRFVRASLEMVSNSIAILTGAGSGPQKGYLRNGQHAAQGGYQAVKLSREV